MKINKTSTFRWQTKPAIPWIDGFYWCKYDKYLKPKPRKKSNKEKKESNYEKWFNTYKYEIQKLLNKEALRLHKEFSSAERRWNMELFYNLQYSRQEKYSIYEKKIISEWYLDKSRLNIVIIEDLIDIRYKIIEILPEMLWDKYRISFQTIDNFEDAKTDIEITNLVWQNLEKTFYILDNNFYFDDKTENIKIDAWIELYNFILSNPIIRKEFLENITILSSDENIWLKFPEWVNIIKWKSDYNTNYILQISNWIKSILEK